MGSPSPDWCVGQQFLPCARNSSVPETERSNLMPDTTIDVEAFYAALDAQRQEEELSWREVARHLGISPSTLTRIAQGKRPDVDTFATLLRWLGMSADAFMRPVTKKM